MKRRVLVTGASKGIGQATAVMLADNFHIVIHYNSYKEGAENTLNQILSRGESFSGEIIQFDITDRQSCHDVITDNIELNGAYYGVVSNAGICRDVVFPAMEGDDWDDVVHTNLDSFYNVIKPCIMPMMQMRKGGRIVTLASVSGIAGNRGQVNYSAAKAGIIGATKALALELAKRKITVNCVAPGLIETSMIDDVELTEILKYIPSRRVGKPEEVASLIHYLMSDLAGYITRQVISVNGGIV